MLLVAAARAAVLLRFLLFLLLFLSAQPEIIEETTRSLPVTTKLVTALLRICRYPITRLDVRLSSFSFSFWSWLGLKDIEQAVQLITQAIQTCSLRLAPQVLVLRSCDAF